MNKTRSYISLLSRSITLAACCFVGNGLASAQVQPLVSELVPKSQPTRVQGLWKKEFERTAGSSSAEERVGELREIQRAPLFDNFPFLHLKQGDKLMAGPAWSPRRKADSARFEKADSYFVLHDGRYFKLEASRDNGELRLQSVFDSVLFDWEVTLASATQLRPTSARWKLEPQKFLALRREVRQRFPEAWTADETPTPREPLVEGEGKAPVAVFESLEFDPYENAVFLARLSISNSRFLIERQALLQGPPRVERREFEGWESQGRNGGGSHQPTPEEATLRRQEYRRMRDFQRVVEPFLDAALPSYVTGEPLAPGAFGG